jgi:tetratricopeptide (TPR) repeat protein
MADLKTLYVAITRTMEKLVWYEEDHDRIAPFRTLFSRLGLVNEAALDEGSVARLHRTSSPEEWRKRGRVLFEHQQYDQARRCFTQSGDKQLARWAAACHAQKRAKEACVKGSGEFRRIYVEAAHLFGEAGKLPQEAECYEEGREYGQAGRVHVILGDWWNAARCYEVGQDWLKAQEAHERRADEAGQGTEEGLNRMERSLACLLQNNDPDLLQRAQDIMTVLLQNYGQTVPARVVAMKEALVYHIAQDHHRAGQRKLMMGPLVKLSSVSMQRRFLRTRGYKAQLEQARSRTTMNAKA